MDLSFEVPFRKIREYSLFDWFQQPLLAFSPPC